MNCLSRLSPKVYLLKDNGICMITYASFFDPNNDLTSPQPACTGTSNPELTLTSLHQLLVLLQSDCVDCVD